MNRKIIITFSILAILLFALVLYIRLTSPQDNEVIRIGYRVESLNHAPVMVAYEAGIFNEHNLKVEIVPLSAKEVEQALATGKIDIGSSGVTNFFIPISKGVPIKIIAPSSISSTLLFVRPDSNIKTFRDLVGKTIASQIGGGSDLVLGYALRKEGISLTSINFVDIEKTLRPIALMEKKIVDAAVAGDYEEKIYLDAGAILLEEWGTKGYANKPFPKGVIGVNSNFMNKNKKAVSLFIDAFIESQRFIKNNPDETAKIIAKHIEKMGGGAVKFSPEDVKKSWQELAYVLWYDPNDLVEVSKIQKEMGSIESALSLDQFFDLSFEKKLKNAQNEIYPIN